MIHLQEADQRVNLLAAPDHPPPGTVVPKFLEKVTCPARGGVAVATAAGRRRRRCIVGTSVLATPQPAGPMAPLFHIISAVKASFAISMTMNNSNKSIRTSCADLFAWDFPSFLGVSCPTSHRPGEDPMPDYW